MIGGWRAEDWRLKTGMVVGGLVSCIILFFFPFFFWLRLMYAYVCTAKQFMFFLFLFYNLPMNEEQ
jgi:hypothetical protein